MSLLNYNVSDPEGESIEFVYTLTPNASIVISVTNIPGNAYFLVVQAHTYFRNVTLSYGPKPTPSTSVSGTNIGLWKAVSLSTAQFYLSHFSGVGNTSLMLAVQAYGNLGKFFTNVFYVKSMRKLIAGWTAPGRYIQYFMEDFGSCEEIPT